MGSIEIKCMAETHGEHWQAFNGDCVNVMQQMPDCSIDFSIYSPPFGSLFIYSDSAADFGNNACDGDFFNQYGFAVDELFRVTKPGRLCAVHCSDLPTRKWIDGHIAINPFSDAVLARHREAGWLLHCRITIWRDPVVEMQRTKALGLLYKQIQKDSTKSRAGLPDYLLVFRKPGDNPEPVGHRPADFPVERWQQWASPVWMDINQTDVLNGRMAREQNDERHICPLQLDLIERAIVLWSNPGDVVLSPFMGIGSEGFQAVKLKRRFIGTELKESYWRQAAKYLDEAEREAAMPDLFAA